MLHTKFHGNQSTGSREEDLLSFLPYMGNFHFQVLYSKACIQNLVKNSPVVSEKSKFQFSNVNDLGPMSGNDLDLQYSLHKLN